MKLITVGPVASQMDHVEEVAPHDARPSPQPALTLTIVWPTTSPAEPLGFAPSGRWDECREGAQLEDEIQDSKYPPTTTAIDRLSHRGISTVASGLSDKVEHRVRARFLFSPVDWFNVPKP